MTSLELLCNGAERTGTGEAISGVEAGGSATARKCVNSGRATLRQLTDDLKPPRHKELGNRRVLGTSHFTGMEAGEAHLQIGRRKGKWNSEELTSTQPTEHGTWGRDRTPISDNKRTNNGRNDERSRVIARAQR
ncbi:hypothetical protein GN244_ATG06361 [Phytophthora infestans]|uniref:Uncharacterized protein n=1 Tax=Phytophthora infestans TaxID=4787 RepID=A0A833T2N6_PHYIN|nr:hypothetical protein GN244_ATG06361 [Phytophthora infestans]